MGLRAGAGESGEAGFGTGFGIGFTDEEGRGYRSAEELGRGVLTTVCRAEREASDAESPISTSISEASSEAGQLVLKTVLPLWVGHPLAEARIAREREVSRALDDDVRCARVLAGGRQAETDDPGRRGRSRPFHVSRRLIGVTLAHRMTEANATAQGGLGPAVVLGWMDALLGTLASVHAAGWVHRDVKPQNLVLGGLTPRCVPETWLIDFGLALPVGRSRRDGDDAFGTPAYVSPEVIAGAPVDERADLYSVGLVAYELLAGRRPFCSRDPVALLDAHLSDNAPPLRSIAPEISPELERVVAAALEKSPIDRPATAVELRRLFAACPDSQGDSHVEGRNAPATTKEDCTVRTNG
jgi:serine/threonine protein kinase